MSGTFANTCQGWWLRQKAQTDLCAHLRLQWRLGWDQPCDRAFIAIWQSSTSHNSLVRIVFSCHIVSRQIVRTIVLLKRGTKTFDELCVETTEMVNKISWVSFELIYVTEKMMHSRMLWLHLLGSKHMHWIEVYIFLSCCLQVFPFLALCLGKEVFPFVCIYLCLFVFH